MGFTSLPVCALEEWDNAIAEMTCDVDAIAFVSDIARDAYAEVVSAAVEKLTQMMKTDEAAARAELRTLAKLYQCKAALAFVRSARKGEAR